MPICIDVNKFSKNVLKLSTDTLHVYALNRQGRNASGHVHTQHVSTYTDTHSGDVDGEQIKVTIEGEGPPSSESRSRTFGGRSRLGRGPRALHADHSEKEKYVTQIDMITVNLYGFVNIAGFARHIWAVAWRAATFRSVELRAPFKGHQLDRQKQKGSRRN